MQIKSQDGVTVELTADSVVFKRGRVKIEWPRAEWDRLVEIVDVLTGRGYKLRPVRTIEVPPIKVQPKTWPHVEPFQPFTIMYGIGPHPHDKTHWKDGYYRTYGTWSQIDGDIDA